MKPHCHCHDEDHSHHHHEQPEAGCACTDRGCKEKPSPAHGEAGHCHCGCHAGQNCGADEASPSPVLLSLSALLLLLGIIFRASHAAFFTLSWVQPVWFLVAYLLVSRSILLEMWRLLRQKMFFNEFVLMSIASIGAFCLGEYPEAVAVMLFYSIGEYFQELAVRRVRGSIESLIDLQPDVARVCRAQGTCAVNPQEVLVGETIEVLPGSRVPLDGELLDDMATFDTAALTGESIPRTVEKGGEVLSGMIAEDRLVHLRVTKPLSESTLTRVLKLVEEAVERKAPAERFIRKFARYYTPTVTGLALLMFLLPCLYGLLHPGYNFVWQTWAYRALIFLVISCPCALVISIPLSYFAGIGVSSGMGVLFKGSSFMDALMHVNAVALDKTGTVTDGSFVLQAVCPAEGVSADRLLSLLASADAKSTHPLAKAVVREALLAGASLQPAGHVQEIKGKGVCAEVQGTEVLVGNVTLLQSKGIAGVPQESAMQGTVVLCAAGGAYIGCVVMADNLRPDAETLVRGLKKRGIKQVVLLSGDKQTVVDEVADRLKATAAYGNLLPEDKLKKVEELQQRGYKVAYLGDGINDAPVIALSDVGVAMGEAGSKAAIEIADVVIQASRPSKLLDAMRVAEKTRRVIKENIIFVLGIKFIVMILGTFGFASLWMAIFADVGVALLAVLNAMKVQRVRRIKAYTN